VNPWRLFPLIRLLIPIITGTATGLLIDNGIQIPLVITIVLLSLTIALVFIKPVTPVYKKRWLTGMLICILLLFLAYQNTIRTNDRFDQDYFMKDTVGRFYIGDLIEPAVQKQKTSKTVINVIAVYSNRTWRPVKGKALIYLKKDNRSEQLFYGDRIILRTEFTEPRSAGFPYAFDQKRFLNNQNIYYTGYINSVCWKKIDYSGTHDLLRLSLLVRNKLLQILRDNQVQGREFAVIAALLLGYVDDIDHELIKDYSATGAMHILSVSGMHVGIIFLVLEKILGFLRKIKHGIVLKTSLIILMIWFYAMLTGLSPAVLRASVMISLVAVGKAMKRQPDILNILSASFIILLVHDPTLLVNVGFQLSYLAVAGIVLLYKPVYDLFITSNHLLDKIWSIVAVSIAAQIITFPLSLFYFHQFPNYFILTNILVVPLSSLIIYTGIILLFCGAVPVVSMCLAKILIALVWFLNNSIHFIEGLPFAVTKAAYLSIEQMIVVYLLVSLLFLFLFYKKKMFLFLFITFTISLTGSFLFQKTHQLKSKRIIVYGANNLPAFDFINGQTNIFLCDPKAKDNSYFEENHQAASSAMGIKSSIGIMLTSGNSNSHGFLFQNWLYKKGNFIQFNNKRLFLLSRKLPGTLTYMIHIDYVVLTGNPQVTIEQIRKIFVMDEIFVDPSNSRWRSNAWKAEAAKLGVKIHVVSETGTYEIDF
jgi:competence protein ComEC